MDNPCCMGIGLAGGEWGIDLQTNRIADYTTMQTLYVNNR